MALFTVHKRANSFNQSNRLGGSAGPIPVTTASSPLKSRRVQPRVRDPPTTDDAPNLLATCYRLTAQPGSASEESLIRL